MTFSHKVKNMKLRHILKFLVSWMTWALRIGKLSKTGEKGIDFTPDSLNVYTR